MSQAKAKLNGCTIILPLSFSQGGIRIADKDGNHFPCPTKTLNKKDYYVEWMITNKEIKLLSKLKRESEVRSLIKILQNISDFAADSDYSRRTTSSNEKEIAKFGGFHVYQYTEIFNSFEKILDSTLRVRLTFKLGDFGVSPHPHMYVLVPFDFKALRIKNKEGNVEDNEALGSGCFAELNLTEGEINEVIITLAHASKSHRKDLIKVLES